MKKRTKEILDEALALPEPERSELVELIAVSLEEGIYWRELHSDWISELDRRQREMEASAAAVPSRKDSGDTAQKKAGREHFRFHREAEGERRQALTRYQEIDTKVEQRFEEALDHGLQLIAERPQAWPAVDAHRRRYRIPRFPYWVVYTAADERMIHILAVAHMAGRPGDGALSFSDRTETRQA